MKHRIPNSCTKGPIWGIHIARSGLLILLLVLSPTKLLLAQNHQGVATDVRLQRLLVRGLTRMYVEDFEGATTIFEEALKIKPNDPALLASICRARMALSDYGSAQFYLQRALTTTPDDAALWRLSAELNTASGDVAAVLAAHYKILELNPDDFAVHLDLIRLLERLERHDEGLAASEAALEALGPQRSILIERSIILERLGRTDDFENSLRSLIELDPDELAFQMQLGSSIVRRGALTQAAGVFEHILTQAPDHRQAVEALADVLTKLGQSDEAAEVRARFERSLGNHRSNNGRTQVNDEPIPSLGEASIESLQALLEEQPTNVDLMSTLAGKLLDAMRYLEAAYTYRHLVNAAPRRLDDWSAGIAAFVAGGAPEQGLEMAESALALFPGYVPILIDKVHALVAASEVERAVSLIRELQGQDMTQEQKGRLRDLLSQIEAM